MTELTKHEAHDHAFEEVDRQEAVELSQQLQLDDLRQVKLDVSATLGRSRMKVREVLELKAGSVVSLDKMAGEMTDIAINGMPLAKGEVVVIGDVLHVRIAEVTGAGDGARSHTYVE